MAMRAKERKTLILPPALGHPTSSLGYIYHNFARVAYFWSSSNRDATGTTLKLNCLKFKLFKLALS
jgi:hypothetical protein